MKSLITIAIAGSLIIARAALGEGVDYTNRNYTTAACELFAIDAWQAADNFSHGAAKEDVLHLIERAPVADSQKHRAWQAVELVWDNRLDNPLLAYTVAMGLCVEPKNEMAPINEPWVTSPRTNREFF